MTFDDVEIISFNDEAGNQYSVRNKKDIDAYETGVEIDVIAGTEIDEVASRPEHYGNNGEDLSYAIFEANIEALTESGFDVGKIKKLKVPVLASV